MTNPTDVFRELETLTGHGLPVAWLSLMRNFPESLAKRTYPRISKRIADHELYNDPRRVLELNRDVREEPVWGEGDEDDAPWKTNRLAIGKDLSGDIVFLDTSCVAPPVQRFLVASGRVIDMAPDLMTFVEILDTPEVLVPRI